MAENALLGTTLSVSETQAGTYLPLYGMSKVPDMAFEPDKIEVTNLSDTNKRYVPGIVDLGQPEFEFFNNNEVDTTEKILNSYKKLRTFELAKEAVWFKLMYPDGTGFNFGAYITTTRTGGGTGDALSFKIKLLITTNITDIPGIGSLTFTCVAGAASGATKVASVSPTLTSGNSYVYVVGVNLLLPALGAEVSGTAYTLGSDIIATASQEVMLIEVTASWAAVKAGISAAVPLS